jgi:hypothetical protein
MKTLLLAISIFMSDSVDSKSTQPEDVSWLDGQWNTSLVIDGIMEDINLPGSLMIFVDIEGNKLATIPRARFDSKELTDEQTKIYLKSDFFFEANNGDTYYLSE